MSAQERFDPMTTDDLAWVVAHEDVLHAFPWTHGNFLDALDAGYVMLVMRRDEVPVAYAVMLLVVDEAHLLNLSVIAGMQGRGLGQRFLRYLFGHARQNAATQFFLEVRPSNAPAIALYEKVGFVPVGRRKRYYPAENGGREDAILMRYEL